MQAVSGPSFSGTWKSSQRESHDLLFQAFLVKDLEHVFRAIDVEQIKKKETVESQKTTLGGDCIKKPCIKKGSVWTGVYLMKFEEC